MMKVRLKKIYKCDPYKNKSCSKTGCLNNGGYCGATVKRECAAIDPYNGKPILLREFNMWVVELKEE